MQCFDARKPSHFNQISFDRSTAAYIEFMLCVNIPTMQGVIVINLSIKKNVLFTLGASDSSSSHMTPLPTQSNY